VCLFGLRNGMVLRDVWKIQDGQGRASRSADAVLVLALRALCQTRFRTLRLARVEGKQTTSHLGCCITRVYS
jgi:hypothetical protein